MNIDDNVILISGSDDAEIKVDARETVRKTAGDNPDAFALDTVTEGDDYGPVEALKQTLQSIMSPPFMGGKKTVWLKNFSSFNKESKKAGSGTAGSLLNELTEKIRAGLPDDIVLIMSGPGIDRRKSLYKICNSSGAVRIHDKPDIKDRGWQEKMRQILHERAAEKNLEIDDNAAEYMLEMLGTNTDRLESELEKLLVYCGGPGNRATLEDIRRIGSGEGETAGWALKDAIGHRNLERALTVTESLLADSRDSDTQVLGLLIQTTAVLRHMLQVKIFMYKEKLRHPQAVKTTIHNLSGDKEKEHTDAGLEIVSLHPYRAMMLAEQSQKFGGNELVEGIKKARDAYQAIITGAGNKREILDNFLVALCARPSGKSADKT